MLLAHWQSVAASRTRGVCIRPPISRSDVLLWKRPARIWHAATRSRCRSGGCAPRPACGCRFPYSARGSKYGVPCAIGPHARRPTCEVGALPPPNICACARRAERRACLLCTGRTMWQLQYSCTTSSGGRQAHSTPAGPPAWTGSSLDTDRAGGRRWAGGWARRVRAGAETVAYASDCGAKCNISGLCGHACWHRRYADTDSDLPTPSVPARWRGDGAAVYRF